MLITFLLLPLLIAFICGVAIGRAGRDRLRLELAQLIGKHETLRIAYQDMRRIAYEAIQAAKEKHFPKADPPITRAERDDLRRELGQLFRMHGITLQETPQDDMERQRKAAADARPNYRAPEVEHCSKCAVAVRASSWPQPCPACGTLIDPILDANEIKEADG